MGEDRAAELFHNFNIHDLRRRTEEGVLLKKIEINPTIQDDGVKVWFQGIRKTNTPSSYLRSDKTKSLLLHKNTSIL